jgi:hypothetical protein
MSKQRKSKAKDPLVEELNRCAKWFICGFLLSALIPVIVVAMSAGLLFGMDWLNAPGKVERAPIIANEVPTTPADRGAYAAAHYVPPDPRQPIKPGRLPTAAELRNQRTVVVQELDF